MLSRIPSSALHCKRRLDFGGPFLGKVGWNFVPCFLWNLEPVYPVFSLGSGEPVLTWLSCWMTGIKATHRRLTCKDIPASRVVGPSAECCDFTKLSELGADCLVCSSSGQSDAEYTSYSPRGRVQRRGAQSQGRPWGPEVWD